MKKVVLFILALLFLLYLAPKFASAQEGVSCSSKNITVSTDPNPVLENAPSIRINFQNIPNGTYALRFGCGVGCQRNTPSGSASNGQLSIPVDNSDGKLNTGEHTATLIIPTNDQAFCGDVTYKVVNTADKCNQVILLNVNPTSGNRTTMFTISGVVASCAATNIAVVAESQSDPNDKRVLRPEVMTDSNGRFEARDISFPDAGIWNVRIFYFEDSIPQGMTRTVTIKDEGGSVLKCGDVALGNSDTRCPAECLPTNIGGTWKCGDINSEVQSRCQTGIDPIKLRSCSPGVSLATAVTCKKNEEQGYVCINSDLRFCRAADGSLRCQPIPNTSSAGEPCNPVDGGPGSGGVLTAIGCIPTSPQTLIPKLIVVAAGISGGIALLLMVLGAIQMMTSGGNPEAIKKGRDQFIAAAIGLLFIILSTTILRILGVDILGIPGFS